MKLARIAFAITIIGGFTIQFLFAADDNTWLMPTRQSKLTEQQKHKIELLLAHDIINRPGYHDISPYVKVIKVPENSPLRRASHSKKLQLLADYAVLPAPDGRKVLIFSYDEAQTGRISVCGIGVVAPYEFSASMRKMLGMQPGFQIAAESHSLKVRSTEKSQAFGFGTVKIRRLLALYSRIS